MMAKRIGSLTLLIGFLGLGLLCWWSVEAERERAQTLHDKNQKLALQVRANELQADLAARLRSIRAGEKPSLEEFIAIEVDQNGRMLKPESSSLITNETFVASLPPAESKVVRQILEAIVEGQGEAALQMMTNALKTLGRVARPFVLYHYANLLENLNQEAKAHRIREDLIREQDLGQLPQAVVADLLMHVAEGASPKTARLVRQVAQACVIPILQEPRDPAFFWLHDLAAALSRSSVEAEEDVLRAAQNKLMCHRLRSEFLREDLEDAVQAGKVNFAVSSFDIPFAWWKESGDSRSSYRIIQPRFPEALEALLEEADQDIEVRTNTETLAELSVPMSGIARDVYLCVFEPNSASVFPWRSLSVAGFLFLGLLVLFLGFRNEQRALAESRKALESKSSFLANVSHQLKTPVTNLRLFAETLAGEQVADAKEKKRMLEIISTESARLGSYLHRILANARLENQDPVIETIEVADLIHSRLDHWTKTASLSGVRLRLSLDKDLPTLNGDAPSLADGLDNVVENAIAFTPADGMVEVRARGHETKLEIFVIDHGPGIPESDQSQIFERFFRGEHARARRGIGTGLGLHIAALGAKRAGGTLKIAATSDQGTTMVFSFPLSLEPSPA